MSSGAFVISNLAKLNMFEGATGTLRTGSSNYRLALVTNSWTPAPTTDEVWATLSGNEISATGQTAYVTGGATLTSVVLNQTTGTVKLTSGAQIWTADGTGIPAWRYAVIYYLGTLNSKVNPLICYCFGELTVAGSFINGTSYTIVTPGTTDFTLIGAANSNAGTVFTATGVGSGTGTASTNIPVTTASNTLSVTMNSSGIITVS
jgi:hypothetical protein